MAGVSIGWFDPHMITSDPPALARAIEATFYKHLADRRAFPLHVANIGGSPVSYALVDGHIPLHRDRNEGEGGDNGQIFQLVLGVRNRPTLLTSPATAANDALIGGTTQMVQATGLSALELKVGMAVHFDITNIWHGVTSMPTQLDEHMVSHAPADARTLPMAAIIQVAGIAATDIERAVNEASRAAGADAIASAFLHNNRRRR